MLGPQKFNQYNEEADDLVRLQTKIAPLDGIEANIQSPSTWLSYGTIGTLV